MNENENENSGESGETAKEKDQSIINAELAPYLEILLETLIQVKEGDFSIRLPVPKSGIIKNISKTLNEVIGLNENLANELIRVSKIIVEEGKLTEQAQLKKVTGSWESQIDAINRLIISLAQPTTEIARIITSIAEGDLSKKMALEFRGIPIKGEFLQIAQTVNTMIKQLNSFASEVTRIAREVGAEGKLGGQAIVPGVAGTWKELTENVNMLAGNLTSQVRNIAEVTTAVANGDLSKKIAVDAKGEILALKGTINAMVDKLNVFGTEVTRIAREVGVEGKLGGQAAVPGAAGTWKELTENVNMLAGNLTSQVRNIAEVTTAVSKGDLSRKITVEAKGEILALKGTINAMVDQLNVFGSEVTRIAREVGVDGKLGGQAEVPGVAGTWKELTTNVNSLASNLTNQVRGIVEVSTAIANGDLSKKITIEVKGEILELKDTINGMVDNLSEIIGEINEVMELVGQGDLRKTINAQASGEFAAMVEGMNSTIESLIGIVLELNDAGMNAALVSQNMLRSGQEMNTMVAQMAGSVEQIAEGAKAQALQVASASRESEEAAKTATNTFKKTEDMKKTTEVANSATQKGTNAMNDTLKSAALMLQGSVNSVTSIASLKKSNEQIQEIVDVIRDIATQTNILAINAAIEAVRAGKQGKGFAVVAEQVKTLSADSKTQTKQISGLVKSIQDETNNSVGTIKTMAENVELGKKSTEQTSDAFKEIARSIERFSTTAEEISSAAADQRNSIDIISKSLDKISGIATDTSTSSNQAADSAKNLLAKMQEFTSIATSLADMSQNLQQTVGRFNVGAETAVKSVPSAESRKQASFKSKTHKIATVKEKSQKVKRI